MKPAQNRFVAGALFLALLATTAFAATLNPTRYLHVRVSNPATHELVRVNIPLELAEKVIPAINRGQLQDGKICIGDFRSQDINLHAILEALKTAPEGEFVTVQDTHDNVRVAKERGQLVVHVMDNGNENVDVTIPWNVAEALISDVKENQLNLEAGIKALETVGDATLVRVSDHDENIRVWIDSRSTDGE